MKKLVFGLAMLASLSTFAISPVKIEKSLVASKKSKSKKAAGIWMTVTCNSDGSSCTREFGSVQDSLTYGATFCGSNDFYSQGANKPRLTAN